MASLISYLNQANQSVTDLSGHYNFILVHSDSKHATQDQSTFPTRLMRSDDLTDREQWALLASIDNSPPVNGLLSLGIRILRHNDVFKIPETGCQVSFNGESTPRVIPFASQNSVACAQCQCQIEPESPAVQCPRCNYVCHDDCWADSEKCCKCGRTHETAIPLS